MSKDTPGHTQEGASLEGVYSIDRITYSNAETGYAVVRLVPADQPAAEGFVAVGAFGEPRVGECYRIVGIWRRDPKHGLQVRVSSVNPEAPRTVPAIERYLAGASIKGIGPHYAGALVKHFGAQTYDELQNDGTHLQEVPGIGPVRAQLIRDSWAEHKGIHELMINLQGVAGLSPSQAQRIYREYGQTSWLVVSQNPYRLAEEVRGFGFKTCDRIARSLGIAHDAPARIQAGIVHLMNEALAEGHLWSPVDGLVAQATVLLEVTEEALLPQVEALVGQGRAVREAVGAYRDTPALGLYLPRVAYTEQRIAERLAVLLASPPRSALKLSPMQAKEMVNRLGHAQLTEEQRGAVIALLGGARLVILTGGPGTGKTTTVRSLIACLDALRVSYALCATTGRASKQLETSTQRSAATVHRHLRIGLTKDDAEPVRETVLIIDESSMIDLWLLDQIVARLTPGTHLFLVGDVDQLPAVGPGAALQDLIAAGSAPTPEGSPNGLPGIHVVRLTHIFRQEAGAQSLIVLNCHRVRAGERPVHDATQGTDYYEMYRDTAREARDLAVELVATRLPKFLGVPPSEVQLLAPMHNGEAGIRALNSSLQQTLNPSAPGKREQSFPGLGASAEQGRVLREGDKVRQTRNNYQKQVLNGDLGTISHINPDERTLSVRYDEREVSYFYEELEELTHAWAMTVHSAQGSQWPAVVIVMLKNHYVMLERNILYTALSRAQRLAVLITQEQAVRIAIAEDRSTRRRTNLVARLRASLAQTRECIPLPPPPGRLFA